MVAERCSKKGATVCEKMTALAPESPDVWLLRGDALFYSGHPDQAIPSYEKAGQLGAEKADEFVEKCRRVLKSRSVAGGGGSGADRHELASQHFNMAHASIRAGDRGEAVQHYMKCMELVGEATSGDRTFKAFAAYQCGVCLLNQFQLLGGVDPAWFSKPQKQAASDAIRDVWGTTLRLYRTLQAAESAIRVWLSLAKARSGDSERSTNAITETRPGDVRAGPEGEREEGANHDQVQRI